MNDYARRLAERDQRLASVVENAQEMYATFRGFVDAGYTEDQALQLQITMLGSALMQSGLAEMFEKLLGGGEGE